MGFDRTITPESLIETKGLKMAAILAALYNAAVKMGHGTKDSGSDTITEAQAEEIITETRNSQGKSRKRMAMRQGKLYYGWDYLNGKRLKLDLTEAETSGVIAGQYDYGFGRGTAKRAIEILRATGDPCHPDIIALQATAASRAAIVSAPTKQSGTVTEGTLADALGLGIHDKHTCYKRDEKTGYEETCTHLYQDEGNAPCTTYNL
ncbi:MAG: hypothetical protein HY226_01545 [Candidatus Vogelbacteria bacterium]|nr:hypothetical protein [Candidatus Vogelbacteria bacterium]